MKKFDFKKVLILMLSFVMIFALAACGNDTGKSSNKTNNTNKSQSKKTNIDAGVYVNELLKSIQPAFGKKISSEKSDIVMDLKFTVGMGLQDADHKDDKAYASVKNESLNIYAKVYYDRPVLNESTGLYAQNTSAIKVAVTDSDNEPLLAATYSLETPDSIFLLVGTNKVNFKFGIDSAGDNSSFNQVFCKLLTTKLNFTKNAKNVDGSSIDELITQVSSHFGSDVSIDDIIDEIVPILLGKSLNDVLNSLPDSLSSIVNAIKSSGIRGMMTGSMAGNLIEKTSKTVSGEKITYSARLISDMVATAAGFVITDSQLIEDITAIIQDSTVWFNFTTNNGKFENLNIDIKKSRLDVDESSSSILSLSVDFESLEIKEASESFVDTAKMLQEYKTDNCELKLDATLQVSNVVSLVKDSFNPTIKNYIGTFIGETKAQNIITELEKFSDSKSVNLGGKLRVEALGRLDLLKSNSQTCAKANIYYSENGSTEGDLIATVQFGFNEVNSMSKGTLTIKFNNDNEKVKAVKDYACTAIIAALTSATKTETRESLKQQNIVGMNALADGIISGTNCIVVENLEIQTLIWDMLIVKDKRNADKEAKKTLMFSGYNWQAAAEKTKDVEGKKNSWDANQKYAARFYKEKSPVNIFRLVFSVNQIIKHTFTTLTGDYDKMVTEAQNGDKKIDLITFAAKEIYSYFIYNSKADNGFENSVLNPKANNLESDEDFFAYFLKESNTAIIELTNKGILPLVKAEAADQGLYILNTNNHKLYLYSKVASKVKKKPANYGQRYNLVYSKTKATESEVKVGGQIVCQEVLTNGEYVATDFTSGKWFYMNDDLITMDQAKKVYKIATSEESSNETVKAVDGSDVNVSELRNIFWNIFFVDMFKSSSVFNNSTTIKSFIPELANGDISGYLGRFYKASTNEKIQILKAGVNYKLGNASASLKIVADFRFEGDSDFGQFELGNIKVKSTTTIDMAKYFDAVRNDYLYYNTTYVVFKDGKWVIADKNTNGAKLIKDTELIYKGWAGNIYNESDLVNPIQG